eukprot:4809508-Pyramimonas_sp.AAC.1
MEGILGPPGHLRGHLEGHRSNGRGPISHTCAAPPWGPQNRIVEPSWGPLGAFLGAFGAVLAASCAPLGVSGPSRAILGPS